MGKNTASRVNADARVGEPINKAAVRQATYNAGSNIEVCRLTRPGLCSQAGLFWQTDIKPSSRHNLPHIDPYNLMSSIPHSCKLNNTDMAAACVSERVMHTAC